MARVYLVFAAIFIVCCQGEHIQTSADEPAAMARFRGRELQACAALYGQCGGQGWGGATCCAAGTCKFGNQYYSQCLPGSNPGPTPGPAPGPAPAPAGSVPACAKLAAKQDRPGADIKNINKVSVAQCYNACLAQVNPACQFFTYGLAGPGSFNYQRCYLKSGAAANVGLQGNSNFNNYDIRSCRTGGPAPAPQPSPSTNACSSYFPKPAKALPAGGPPGVLTGANGQSRTLTYKQYPSNAFCQGSSTTVSLQFKVLEYRGGNCALCTAGAQCKIWAPDSAGNYEDDCSATLSGSVVAFSTSKPGDESSKGWGADGNPHWHYQCCCGSKCQTNKLYIAPPTQALAAIGYPDKSNIAVLINGKYYYDIVIA